MAWNRNPKIKVLDVVDADGEVLAYYAKGRFSPAEFLPAVEKYAGQKVEGLDRSKQEFWRDVSGDGGGLDVLYRRCTVFDKGAYAVTVLDLEDWVR